MRYEDDLDPGFLLTIPGTCKGKYKIIRHYQGVPNETIYRVSTDGEWGSYEYIRINYCRVCKRFYVIHGKSERYLNITKENPTKTNHSMCISCLNMEKGMDEPLEEFPVPHRHMEFIKFGTFKRWY